MLRIPHPALRYPTLFRLSTLPLYPRSLVPTASHLNSYSNLNFDAQRDTFDFDGDAQKYYDHVFGTRVVGYSYASAVAFLIYDILITFDDEVKLIWPNPLTFTKLAYFFIRYFPVFLELATQFYGAPLPLTYTPRQCYAWNVAMGVSSLLIVACVDYILILRVFALYPRNIIIKCITSFLYCAELGVISVGLGLAIPQLVFDGHCVVTEAPVVFTLSGAAPIAYQTFLFSITIYKFVQALRSGWGDVPMIRLLVRDGTWAFVLLFLVLVGEGALYLFSVKAYSGFLYGWLNTAFSICGYRILLNIHSLSHPRRPIQETTVLTGPEIHFTVHDSSDHEDSGFRFQSSYGFRSSYGGGEDAFNDSSEFNENEYEMSPSFASGSRSRSGGSKTVSGGTIPDGSKTASGGTIPDGSSGSRIPETSARTGSPSRSRIPADPP